MRKVSSKFKALYLLSVFLIAYSPLAGQEILTVTHGPYLIDPAEDAITVVWFTNKPCLSWVEYCGDQNFGVFPVWGGYPKTAKNSRHGLIEANTTRHAIRITNLAPGTMHKYRINSREIRQFDPYEVLYGDTFVGDMYTFETLDKSKKSFSFSVITDVHERAAQLDTLLQKVDWTTTDLMFYTGDILNWIGDELQIFKGFLDVSIDRFAKKKPFVYVRGNHEARGPNARKLMDYFPHHSGQFYYGLRHGKVYFLMLDAGEDKPDSHPVYAGLVDFDAYRTEQAEWLKTVTRNEAFKTARYRIVMVHIPLFTGSKKQGASDATAKWGPVLNEAGIDLMISGHHHQYNQVEKGKNGNSFPVIVVGMDMVLRTDVTEDKLSVSIEDIHGRAVGTMTCPAQGR